MNHLRLWSGRAITPFRIEDFNAGNYAAAVADQIDAKNLTRVLYPDDTTPQGKELPVQAAVLLRQRFTAGPDCAASGGRPHLAQLQDGAAIQLNDTHPA